MYPVFLDANDLCMQLGACAVKSLTSVPTCDECTGSLAAIAGLISDEGQIAEIVAFLQVITCILIYIAQNYVFHDLLGPCDRHQGI